MKLVIVVLMLIGQHLVSAQQSDKQAVQSAIVTFFEGFHQQDSTIIKQVVSEAVTLQTISTDSLGSTALRQENFSEFVRSIVGIPKTTKFEEVIKSFSIQIDGPMANVWAPYEFRLNGAFHHCGVNSFQMLLLGEQWKIIYLIDTRRKEGCE